MKRCGSLFLLLVFLLGVSSCVQKLPDYQEEKQDGDYTEKMVSVVDLTGQPLSSVILSFYADMPNVPYISASSSQKLV